MRGFFGAVAQLGERLVCNQEVAGSIPTSSTSCEESSAPEARFAERSEASASPPALIGVLGRAGALRRRSRPAPPVERFCSKLFFDNLDECVVKSGSSFSA
jgi:hypothetical protein